MTLHQTFDTALPQDGIAPLGVNGRRRRPRIAPRR